MSFDVWWTPAGAASAKKLDKPIADAVDRVEVELERAGCAAASYRLTGEILEHVCVVRLPYDYRMLVAFPSEREVAILLGAGADLSEPAVPAGRHRVRSDRDRHHRCPLLFAELGPELKALLARQDELVAELVGLLNDARRP